MEIQFVVEATTTDEYYVLYYWMYVLLQRINGAFFLTTSEQGY